MDAPLSGKQKRESIKFLFDEMRKTVALKKDQQRKDELHKQKLANTAEKHQVSLDIPKPSKGMPQPTNPEAGPNDKIPALLAPGEAVIPAKAAQKPENKPLIKAMVKEGRSDRNLSVPMPKGFMCGTTKVKGYENGITEVPEVDIMGNITGYTQEVIPPPVVTTSPAVSTASAPQIDYSDDAILNRLLTREGSNLVENDSGSGKSKYGITQKWNPDVDVSNLTSDQAKEIYKNNYLSKVPKDLTPKQREAYLDSVVNQGPDVAKDLWSKSEGDLNKFADLRIDHYKSLVSPKEKRGESAPVNAWTQRANLFRDTADKVLTSVSGSANAAEVPKPNKDQVAEDYYKRDPNRVQVTENNGVYTFESIADQDKRLAKEKQKQEALYGTTPQGATQDFAIDENGMPYKVNTEQEKGLFKQVNEIADVPKVQTKEPQGWMSYISKGLVDGLSNAWDTIKDPNKFAAATSSFIKDTIGLEGADAVRFATLYYGQKALGISDQGAALYAGKYTLGQMDKRADRRATQATQLMTTNKSHIQTLFKERRLSKEGYDLAMKANATGNFGAVDAILAHPNFVTARESAGLIDSKGKEINIVKRGGLNQVVSAYADPSSPGNYLTVTRDKDGKEVVAQLSGKDYRRWSSDFDSVNKVRSFLEQSVDSSKLSRVDDKGKSIPIFKGYGKDSVVNDMMSYYREKEKAGLDTDPAQYVEAAHAAIDHAAKTGEKTPSIKAMLYAYELNPGMFADQKKLSYDGEKGKPIETSRIGTFTKDVAEYSKGRTTDKGKALNPSEYLSGITSAYNEKVDRKQYEKNIDDPTLLSKIKEAPNSYMAYVYWNFYQHSKK